MLKVKEIAKLSGVSASTVSRVINGSANVTEKTTKKVLDVLEATNTKIQVSGDCKNKITKRVCIILPFEMNSFKETLLNEIRKKMFLKGYAILEYAVDENNKIKYSELNSLNKMKVDGIISFSVKNKKVQNFLSRQNIPIIIIGKGQIKKTNVHYITVNYYKCGELAINHLLKCGCKNIVYMRDNQYTCEDSMKYKAYGDICKQNNIRENCVICGHTYEDGIIAGKELIKNNHKIDGIIANSDYVACALNKLYISEGFRIPEDVQIIGQGNMLISKTISPEITTISYTLDEVITLVEKLIFTRQCTKLDCENLINDVSLVKRETTKEKTFGYNV